MARSLQSRYGLLPLARQEEENWRNVKRHKLGDFPLTITLGPWLGASGPATSRSPVRIAPARFASNLWPSLIPRLVEGSVVGEHAVLVGEEFHRATPVRQVAGE